MNTLFTKISLTAAGLFLCNMAQASEFFLKINRSGQHTVLIGDQYQTNSTNIYRFFDLPVGTITVKISDGNTGTLVFDGTLTIGQNQRMVAEMDGNGGITVTNTLTVTWNNWFTDNVEGTNVNTTPPPPPPPPAGPTAVSPEKFKEIKKVISDQIADNYRVEKAKSISKKNFFTSKQIAEICNTMSFDSYKLEFAKFAYDYCVDKDNYFEVSKVFSFDHYSAELDKYVDSK